MAAVVQRDFPLVEKSDDAPRKQPKRSIWPFAVLLAINSLSLPAMLAAVIAANHFFRYSSDQIIYEYVVPSLAAIMYSQLIGLAFWMSFGSWPVRWRGLFIFAMTAFLGLFLGIGVGISESLSSYDHPVGPVLFVIALGVPIFAGALVWMTNAIYAIPAWYFGCEIGYVNGEFASRPRNRTFGVAQMLSWTTQCAVPLALLNAISFLGGGGDKLADFVAPSLFLTCCCTPLMVSMLKSRLSIFVFIGACTWSALTGTMWAYLADDDWAQILPSWCVVAGWITITSNMLTLRWLNLRWRPRIEPVGHPDA